MSVNTCSSRYTKLARCQRRPGGHHNCNLHEPIALLLKSPKTLRVNEFLCVAMLSCKATAAGGLILQTWVAFDSAAMHHKTAYVLFHIWMKSARTVNEHCRFA